MEGLASGDAELKAAQQGPGGKRRVEVIQGAQQEDANGDPLHWMLLQTSSTRLSWEVQIPSQALRCPLGMVLMVYAAGDVVLEKYVAKKAVKANGSLALHLKEISVATVADSETHEDDDDDVPPEFLKIEIYRAVRGDSLTHFIGSSDDSSDDDEGVTIGEGSRKRGYLTAVKKSQSTASKAKARKIDRSSYYGEGKPIFTWKLWAATHEHFIGRAETRFSGLKELVDAKVTLPDALETEYKRMISARSASNAISLIDDSDDDDDADYDAIGGARGNPRSDGGAEDAADDADDDVDDESEDEVKVDAEEDVRSGAEDIVGQQSAAGPSVEAPAVLDEVAGLDEVFKGIAPALKEEARKWIAAQQLTSLAIITELGCEDDFISALNIPETANLPGIIIRNRLAKL